ncbi:GIY-YIG nuclease family protein [Nostoc sp.]|uniref:GIY-YIG nuclease family protein n=1 Tax=Nostoc sp. TaxID=1180 RepID=UPI002FFB031C
MNSGYIYALKNRSFGSNIIKIGMTTRKPDVHAKEIYHGASGVPEPFDIAFACKVADCEVAEKKIHRRFNAYRSNKVREFFIIPI